MRLTIAHIFAEHMVLQRQKPIKIWGESLDNDIITIKLNKQEKQVQTVDGKWMVTLEPEEANFKTTLSIFSSKTNEKIEFFDVAIGEVWLGGGQSNMEFIMKYEKHLEEAKKINDDAIRFFAYPQVSYAGNLEKEGFGKYGVWRKWINEEDKIEFSAIGLYMSLLIKEKLNVPVGVISCNWGGTPASAWTLREDVENNPKLKTIIDWRENILSNLDYKKYYEVSNKKLPKPTEESLKFTDYFMMGGDMSKFFDNPLPPMNQDIFSPFNPGPRACIFPGNLYEFMLSKIAPYALRGFMFYQGEDDDARDWYDFYDESMITLIKSWRNLWQENLPFYQIELAPFKGYKMNGAKHYDMMRHHQNTASKQLDDVYDVCILDVGEEYNIHPRNKKVVGNRLANIIMKHTYNDNSKIADCPELKEIKKEDNKLIISFNNLTKLVVKENLKDNLFINSKTDYEYEVIEDKLVIHTNTNEKIIVDYCEMNYCVASLFNEEENPVFGFRKEIA